MGSFSSGLSTTETGQITDLAEATTITAKKAKGSSNVNFSGEKLLVILMLSLKCSWLKFE